MGKTVYVSSFGEMDRVSVKLKTLSEDYDRISKQLLEEATAMGTAWEGADNEAFVNRISGCSDDLKRMSDKLLSASETLKKQRDNYAARQDENISRIAAAAN